MSTLSITPTKMTIGPFDSDNRYLRIPASAGDAEFISPNVSATSATQIIPSGSDAGFTGWSFAIGSYSQSWNGPGVSTTTINIAV